MESTARHDRENCVAPMRPRVAKLWLALTLGIAMWISTSAHAQDGGALFSQRCAACHSIGQGRMAGPDLKDVQAQRPEAWLLSFIRAPQRMVDSGDATAKALFDEFKMPMPDQDLSDTDIRAVLAYIASKSGGAAAAETSAQTAPSASLPTNEADVLAGQRLFTGEERLSQGGAPCLACHSVNHAAIRYGGGRLAADLSASYAGMGDAVKDLIATPPFPPMAAAYAAHPVTEAEALRITAFLKHAGEAGEAQGTPGSARYLAAGGGIGLLVVLGGLNAVWFRRKKLSTKHRILQRQGRAA
jgi:mono/diheme cytochrome c family protein